MCNALSSPFFIKSSQACISDHTFLSGYGQTGPYREKGGYDVIASGFAGLTHITGPSVSPG